MPVSDESQRMGPPPPGTVAIPSIGDKPVNAKDDYPTPPDAVQVVCVLHGDWPGSTREIRARVPDLGAHYVHHLYQMVSRYAPRNLPWRFVCFTDRESIDGVRCVRQHGGLWSYFNKLYLFAPEHFRVGTRVLFFDLDTCVVGDWTPLATVPLDKTLVMLRDLWAERMPASGVMSWQVSPATHRIWTDFVNSGNVGRRPPFVHTRPRLSPPGVPTFSATAIRTDEQWLYHHVMPDDWYAWQELLPGQLLSYKYDVIRTMRRDGTQHDKLSPEAARAARVVYFHGHPRPHTVVAPWNPLTRGIIDAG